MYTRLFTIVFLCMLLLFGWTVETDVQAQSLQQQMVEEAEGLIGSPYEFGGNRPQQGFDSSGLVQYVHHQYGVDIPRTVAEQADNGQSVSVSNLQKGDVLFFANEQGQPNISAIYIGDRQAIASLPAEGVQRQSVNTNWARDNFVKAKRYHSGSGSDSGSITAGEEATIVSTVNFRAAPSVDSNTYGVLRQGDTVRVIDQVNDYWLHVEADGQTGYISSRPQYVNYDGNGSSSHDNPSVGGQANDTASQIVTTGESYLGTPYEFGANSGSGTFDCSSFVQTVYAEHGIELPRNSRQQSQVGTTVSSSQMQTGDLVFFRNTNRSDGAIDHVAIYVDRNGEDYLLHAVPNGGVQYDQVNSYWRSNYAGAKRVLDE